MIKKLILYVVVLFFVLCSGAWGAVGFDPGYLEQNKWVFRWNVIKVYVSPVEYIQFVKPIQVLVTPKLSASWVIPWVVSGTDLYVYIYVSPLWLYSQDSTTLWIHSQGESLGLPLQLK